MRYFDVADMKERVDPALASRLGFKRIFSLGTDVSILPRPVQQDSSHQPNQIVCSKDTGILIKALRSACVIGIVLEDNEIIGKAIAAAKEAEKPIVVNLRSVFSANPYERYRAIGRIRGVVRASAAMRAPTALISGASSVHYLLSAAQMREVAAFLGQEGKEADRSIAIIGDSLDS